MDLKGLKRMNGDKNGPKEKQSPRLHPWACRCGLVCHAVAQPAPRPWSDGHTCHFSPMKGGDPMRAEGGERPAPKETSPGP
jgi:hypothetical protein